MGKLFYAVVVAIISFVAYKKLNPTDYSELIKEARKDHYYGALSPHKDNTAILPFTVKVEDSVLEDLKNRLKNARIAHEPLEDAPDFWYGFNSKYLKIVKEYWQNKFDWRTQEKIINSFNHFKTEIEGLKIHFIHAHPPEKKYKKIYPILLAHGWPGNVFEFYKLIPILTDPKAHGVNADFAFEVVAPSIPGYGWSEAAHKRGLSQMATARIFAKLMFRLKYQKFYIQGGDWGSLITSMMARLYPEHVLGLHLNTVFVGLDDPIVLIHDFLASLFPSFFIESPKIQKVHNTLSKLGTLILESGYMHIQGTKPDTVGTGLNDSPIGLMAYILEKFATWTNLDNRDHYDGHLTKKFTMDELLTMVMIYWTNGNIPNSQRYYRECFTDEAMQVLQGKYISLPVAHASGLNEMFDRTPLEVSRHMYNITHYTELEDTGHFAAFEEPKQLADSIFGFVHSLH